MRMVIASQNQGKIAELQSLLAPLALELIPQAALGVREIAETGHTFIENALLKARHAAQGTQLPALADDSGLIVPCLNGQPGLKSARYAGDQADASANIARLLSAVKESGVTRPDAYFYCVLTLLTHAEDPAPIIAEGRWHGQITDAARGHQGFGYDPIFYVRELKCTAAECAPALKNQLSHRGQAIQSLLSQLQNRNESISR